MAVSIATLGRERSIATLAKRVYKLDDDSSPEVVARAQSALVAANPGLSVSGGFKTGDRVIVPPITGVAVDTGTRTPNKEAGTDTLAEALQALMGKLSKDSSDAMALARKDAEQTLADMTGGKVREIVAKNAPHLASSLDTVTEAAKKRVEQLKSVQSDLAAALRQAKEDLDKMQSNFG